MIYRLIVPDTLDDIREVRVLEWHGQPGTRFKPGALLVELETHKAVIEVRAGQDGVLRRRFCEEGDWCPLAGVLAVLSDETDEPLPDDPAGEALLAARFSIG